MIALGAIGLAMVYSIAEVPNFAHGDLLMLGAYTALLINNPGNVPVLEALTTGAQEPTTAGLAVLFVLGAAGTLGAIYALGGTEALLGSWWPIDVPRTVALGVHLAVAALVGIVSAVGSPSILAGMIFSGALVAALGPLQERYVFRKFRRRGVSLAMMLVVSLAVAFIVRFGVQTIFGGTTRSYDIQSQIELFGVEIELAIVKFIDVYVTESGVLLQIIDPAADNAMLFNSLYSWPIVAAILITSLAVAYAGYRYRLGTRVILGPYLLGSLLGVATFTGAGLVLGTAASAPESATVASRVRLSILRLFIIVLALTMMGTLHTILRATKLGKAMRATSDNRELAQIRGINVDQVTMGVWVIAGLYAGIGGTALGFLLGALTITMGFFLLLPMFAAVILGGITIYGALLGSYLVGLTMEVGLYATGLDATYRVSMAFVVLMVVLLIKPEGITG
jgi:neutral amino acid transport system permease protein